MRRGRGRVSGNEEEGERESVGMRRGRGESVGTETAETFNSCCTTTVELF